MTEQVLDHHLTAFAGGIDEVMKDYAESSVVITAEGTFEGLDAIRAGFSALVGSFPDGFWDAFEIMRREVVGEVAYITWQAKPYVVLGTDTFVVRDGKIAFQTTASQPG